MHNYFLKWRKFFSGRVLGIETAPWPRMGEWILGPPGVPLRTVCLPKQVGVHSKHGQGGCHTSTMRAGIDSEVCGLFTIQIIRAFCRKQKRKDKLKAGGRESHVISGSEESIVLPVQLFKIIFKFGDNFRSTEK